MTSWLGKVCCLLGAFQFQFVVVVPMVVERRKGNTVQRKYTNWYKKRTSGVKVARSPKPPQWEKEGDLLYQEIVNNQYHKLFENQKITYSKAQELLRKLLLEEKESSIEKRVDNDHEELQVDKNKEAGDSGAANANANAAAADNEAPYLWGGLSVGPVWKTRLLKAGFPSPTPIQTQAFTAITKGQKNVILASTTGSGKSLAYLLPLLALGKKTTGMVWIVTPTMELALQLQGVVHSLACAGGGDPPNSSSILHVVGHEEEDTSIFKESAAAAAAAAQEEDGDSFPLLSSINQSPMMLAGTPLMLQRLKREIDLASSSYKLRIDDDKNIRKTARAISQNLQTIVLDEADRLLQTEAVARNLQSRRQEKETGGSKKPTRQRRLSETTTEHLLGALLLDALPRRKQLQIICASATVGRTLRRQLMQMLQAPSMDKAAVLITADVRTKKDATKRKSSLLPSTLEHAYLLQPDTTSNDPQQDTLDTLWKTMQETLEPAPTLIFPGRVGVDRVQKELRGKGLQGVRGLSANMQTAENGESNDHHDDSPWQTTPVYVVGEKLGRGLDLDAIRYVILLQVPSSAAGYTHLAGRTGRNGEKGTAIAFCQPREAPKLLAIAETLGLSFFDMSSSSPAAVPSEETIDCQPKKPPKVGNENNEENQTLPWAALSESSLQRKTIADINEYLVNHGISLSDENGKKAKKADLLSAVHELHCSAE